MKKEQARFGQTLADMAIQTKGSIEALVDLASENNTSITEVLSPNQLIIIPDARYNVAIETHVKSRGVSPSTANAVDKEGVFSPEFSPEFA